MAIGSALGNIYNSVSNDLKTLFSASKAKIENIIGTTKTSLTNVWDGGFAGLDAKNFESLKTALENYCKDIENHINSFAETTNIENAYKGEINTAAVEYTKAIKEMLNAYVSTMRQNIKEAEVALQSYTTGSQSISKDITQDAESIRTASKDVRLD